MTPEEQLKKVLVENQLLEHYEKIMESMIKWCVFDQPDDISTVATAFGIDLQMLTIHAMKKTLKKWDTDGTKIPD